MPEKTEQQLNIKFLVKLKKTVTEMFNLLYKAYGNSALAQEVFRRKRGCGR